MHAHRWHNLPSRGAICCRAKPMCPLLDAGMLQAETEKGLFWRLKADGHIMIGVTSYEFFPGNATNPYTDRSPQERYPEVATVRLRITLSRATPVNTERARASPN